MENTYKVKKLKFTPNWQVTVPGSKSMTNRALLIAALSDGKTELNGVLFSDDSRHFLSSLQALGFDIKTDENEKKASVTGLNGKIPAKSGEINVGSAGTAARFLTAMLALSDGKYIINASEQMKKRPMKPLFDVLTQLGAKITYIENDGFLPIEIEGIGSSHSTDIAPLHISLDISESTQFLSALLLVSPMLRQGISIDITSKRKSGSYIDITRKMMQNSGAATSFNGSCYTVCPNTSYHSGKYQIEPDVSAACYFYAAAAITGGSSVVENVTWNCMQGDLKFIKLLSEMGCTVDETPAGIRVCGPENGCIKGITVDMKDFSDQAMTLAAIAPFASSPVRIENIGHIRLQESDRIRAITTELSRLGVKCDEESDAVTIYPSLPKAGVVQTYDDHRIAMAFSLIGLRTDGIEIANPMCCKKTFEEYFDVLDMLSKQEE